MKAVKFSMSHTVGTLYAKGETATFEDHVADDLIERKIVSKVAMKKTAAKQDDGADDVEKKAKAELAALKKLDDEGIDKIIADENINVVQDADKDAKIEAIQAARAK